jgi:hypothetical protein
MNRLLKYIVGLTISVASVGFSAGGVEAAPVRCQDAVRKNVMVFDKSYASYSYVAMRESLQYCRISDWMSQTRLYVSPYRNISDYNYYREPATALRNDNLTALRKWMCSLLKEKRANGDWGYQVKYPGCGEKP